MLAKSVVESVMAIATFTVCVILGVFFLGVWARRASQRTALVALIVGLAAMTLIVFQTDLAWPWFAMVGSSITFGVGWVASLLFASQAGRRGLE